ncbi:MAG: sodium:proton antiporter, partial [Rhodospirillaceae bacterium]|nr:sodium:proton antiporter [Rhodospirillaceae bacterium]
LPPPMAFVAFGFLIGAGGLGLADLDFGHDVVHGLAEITLILVLFSDAARIDLRRVRRDHNLPVRMLGIGLPLIVLFGMAIAYVLPLGLTVWEAALLAAVLAPTDAALGQSVVSSKLVPVRIRQALNIESGLNDGISLPVVLLFATLASASKAVEGPDYWLVFGAMQIGLGPLAGIVVGFLGARLVGNASDRGWMSESFEGAAVLALAILAFAAAELLGGNGFLAAFVGGMIFGNCVDEGGGFVFAFAEAESQILTLIAFLLFGASILPEAAGYVTWPVVLYALLSLTAIRAVPIVLSLLGTGLRAPTVGFLAWFGPRGLASILFALFVLEDHGVLAREEILTVTIVTVTLSVLLHGVSAAPLAKWYARHCGGMEDAAENRPVSELPTRQGIVRPREPD